MCYGTTCDCCRLSEVMGCKQYFVCFSARVKYHLFVIIDLDGSL